MNLKETLRCKKDEILKIAAKHGAENLRIFGSVIRNEETAGSDIDFLVDIGPRPSPFFPAGFIADLETLFGNKVDVVTERSLHPFIKKIFSMRLVRCERRPSLPHPYFGMH
ncbi:MAG: nucleotidyltransferase family protein [Deltaproteobacteria bacterium]|nr:MAG: nucleotidyltransferase family protein [Deltaproteobacteria bacterium]